MVGTGTWEKGDTKYFSQGDLADAIGDPSGFYSPMRSDLAVVMVNHQMREEVLPFAYRVTSLRIDDINELIYVLIAIGNIGRQNIETIEVTWESNAEWQQAPNSDDLSLTLPRLHVATCVQLLKQCSRLRCLRVLFENEIINDLLPSTFRNDPSLRELSSVRGLQCLDLCDLLRAPLKNLPLVLWLKEEMESPRQ